jgi:hypothetical protein
MLQYNKRLVLRPTLTDTIVVALCLATVAALTGALISADAHYKREALICQEGC